jgi:hypothetical protein
VRELPTDPGLGGALQPLAGSALPLRALDLAVTLGPGGGGGSGDGTTTGGGGVRVLDGLSLELQRGTVVG